MAIKKNFSRQLEERAYVELSVKDIGGGTPTTGKARLSLTYYVIGRGQTVYGD